MILSEYTSVRNAVLTMFCSRYDIEIANLGHIRSVSRYFTYEKLNDYD